MWARSVGGARVWMLRVPVVVPVMRSGGRESEHVVVAAAVGIGGAGQCANGKESGGVDMVSFVQRLIGRWSSRAMMELRR